METPLWSLASSDNVFTNATVLRVVHAPATTTFNQAPSTSTAFSRIQTSLLCPASLHKCHFTLSGESTTTVFSQPLTVPIVVTCTHIRFHMRFLWQTWNTFRKRLCEISHRNYPSCVLSTELLLCNRLNVFVMLARSSQSTNCTTFPL